jgi:hypothetical protein
MPVDCASPEVLSLADVTSGSVQTLLNRYGMELVLLAPGVDIPGSYWGEREAGLIEHRLYARIDTPLHSVLHEACHYVCMDSQRRAGLERDAGGDYDEENAVCYLQIVLADELPGMGRQRMWLDMDRWGYTFRLGSAQAWFEQDADDARTWLERQGILTLTQAPTWRLRGSTDH